MDEETQSLITGRFIAATNKIMLHLFRADGLSSLEAPVKLHIQFIPGISPNIQLAIETPRINSTLGIWFAHQTADISVFSYAAEKSLYEWHGIFEDAAALLSRIEEAANKIVIS